MSAAKSEARKDFGNKMENISKGNQKLFYRILKSMRTEKAEKIINIEDKDGNIIEGEKNIMERWREYFQELLQLEEIENEEQPEQTINTPNKQISCEEKEDEITIEEFMDAVNGMKSGKMPGHDKITVEMVKCMEIIATEYLLQILNQVYKQ